MSLADLRRSPQELLATSPLLGGLAETTSYAKDLRWLLEQLRDRSAVRIHCGGDEVIGRKGEVWGSDRCFLGGRNTRRAWLQRVLDTFPGKILGTEEPALYKTNRSFPKEQALTPGYRIPLPPARYRVTLHFAELYWPRAGCESSMFSSKGKKP